MKNKVKRNFKARRDYYVAPTFEVGDIEWFISQYEKHLMSNPHLSLTEFAKEYGDRALLIIMWLSVTQLYQEPQKYACLWHGTSKKRADSILQNGFFRSGVYLAYEMDTAISYAQRRAITDGSALAVFACIIDKQYIHDQDNWYVFLHTLPDDVIQFVFVADRHATFSKKSPLISSWQIYFHPSDKGAKIRKAGQPESRQKTGRHYTS